MTRGRGLQKFECNCEWKENGGVKWKGKREGNRRGEEEGKRVYTTYSCSYYAEYFSLLLEYCNVFSLTVVKYFDSDMQYTS
jgi:hypothetical protein